MWYNYLNFCHSNLRGYYQISNFDSLNLKTVNANNQKSLKKAEEEDMNVLNVDKFTFVNYNISYTGKDGAEVYSLNLFNWSRGQWAWALRQFAMTWYLQVSLNIKFLSILANCQVEDLKENDNFWKSDKG